MHDDVLLLTLDLLFYAETLTLASLHKTIICLTKEAVLLTAHIAPFVISHIRLGNTLRLCKLPARLCGIPLGSPFYSGSTLAWPLLAPGLAAQNTFSAHRKHTDTMTSLNSFSI